MRYFDEEQYQREHVDRIAALERERDAAVELRVDVLCDKLEEVEKELAEAHAAIRALKAAGQKFVEVDHVDEDGNVTPAYNAAYREWYQVLADNAPAIRRAGGSGTIVDGLQPVPTALDEAHAAIRAAHDIIANARHGWYACRELSQWLAQHAPAIRRASEGK